MQASLTKKLLGNAGLVNNALQATRMPSTSSILSDTLTPYIGVGGVRHLRARILNKVMKQDPESVKHHGFTFYPRHPDQKDPPYEPAKLFMVTKIKSVRGQPYWEKYLVGRHFKLQENGTTVIVKNTPETNQKLYRIKHLVEIKPITFPNGFPTDTTSGFLDHHGRYVNYKLLDVSPEDAQKSLEKLGKKKVDGITMRNRLRLRWQQRWEVM